MSYSLWLLALPVIWYWLRGNVIGGMIMGVPFGVAGGLISIHLNGGPVPGSIGTPIGFLCGCGVGFGLCVIPHMLARHRAARAALPDLLPRRMIEGEMLRLRDHGDA